MNRIELLEQKTRERYEARHPDRANWADWLYAYHLFVVVEQAKRLSKIHGVQGDRAVAAAMLHDIADSEMSRFDPRHLERSVEIAEDLLRETAFSEAEIEDIKDTIRYNGCHDGYVPASFEGKIMATADAIAHLSTDFYDRSLAALKADSVAREKILAWALPKIERDFHDKIFFDDVREEVRPDYERVKRLFVS
ncbi:MAG: HD domain-containing protein [Candidatus Moranbacteria bacterium]|nr:HD domain-containing protein [Candidatus Moranbacteria bacterium]